MGAVVDDFFVSMESAFNDCNGESAWSMHRDRIYNGQPHTTSGERGKTLVDGLTMRDIRDCIVMGFLDAGGIEKEHPVWDDVYSLECDFDPLAVASNAICHIEKMMGIFPNIPKPKENEVNRDE